MSYYRDTYLKSDHWSALRNARLDHSNCQCSICGKISPKNDVHHIDYAGSLWRVSVSDIRVLCRSCHSRVHDYERTHADVASLSPRQKWKTIFAAISDPIYQEKRLKRQKSELEHRRNFADLWTPVFETCKGSMMTLSLLVRHLEAMAKRESDGLVKIRAHNEPGLEKEYRNSISAWLQGSSLSERSRNKLNDEVRRRRNYGIKAVAYRCESTEEGNVLVDISVLTKKPHRLKIKREIIGQYFPKSP